MITHQEMDRFFAYRQSLFKAIAKSLAEDGHCKHYEGAIQICFPNYFEDGEPQARIILSLDCYVLGPTRHYSYQGKTLTACLDRAEMDLYEWDKEAPAQESRQ